MIHALTDQELEKNLKSLLGKERKLLCEILMHIREVDARTLYLKRAYPSLFAYLTELLGYSEASAQRRIAAARLSREVPELLEKIESGALKLSQVAMAYKVFRRAKPSIEKMKEILAKMEHMSSRTSEEIIARELNIPKISHSKVTTQSDGSVRLEVTLCKEQWENLQRCKELLAHKNPQGDLAEVVAEACDFFLKKKDPLWQAPVTSAAQVDLRKGRHPIRSLVRRRVFQRDQQCQYRDPETGRQCGAHFHLELDHIQKVRNGGTNEIKNLRVLCRSHNNWLG